MVLFKQYQFLHQPIIVSVTHQGIIKLMISLIVILNQLPEFSDPG
jgi:hypothetical protein